MIAFPRFAILTAFLLVALLGGCGSSQNYVFNGSGDQNAPPSGRIASIRVTPASLVMAPGQTEELEVVATYVNGVRRNVSRWVSWSVSPTSLATVSPESIVTALAPGQGRLTATLEGVSGSCELTVLDEGSLTSLTVTPPQATVSVAGRQQFRATAGLSTGQEMDVTELVEWASSEGNVATISNASSSEGLAQGRAPGQVTISARLGNLRAQASLTVTAATLESLTVTPANPNLHPGNTQSFRATGRYSDGTSRDLTSSVSWSAGTPAVASISPSGLATALTDGTTQITASLQSVSGSTTLTVSEAALLSIEVLPANATQAVGSDRQYRANGRYDDNSTLDITTQVAWVSSAPAVATVTPSGLVDAVSAGTTSISATLDSVVGSTGLTVVAPTLVSIAIVPEDGASIVTGTTVAYRATGTFADGSTADVTQSVTWSTSDPLTATVSNDDGTRGQVRGERNGLVEISASEGSIQATVDARVMLYLYGTDGRSVFGYTIEPSSGALGPLPDFVEFGGCICQVRVDPTNRFLYALDGINSVIYTVDIDPGTGRLTARPGSVSTGEFPDRMAVSPTGDTLFVTDADAQLFGFTIGGDGTLTPAANPAEVGQATIALAFDATGRYLYAADLADNILYGFAVDSDSAALTPLAGSPYETGDGPFGVATSSNGNFVYVVNARDANVSGYQAAANGSLTPLSGFPVELGGSPYNLVADPLGRFFYAIDFTDASVHSLAADASTGALTAVAGQPFEGTGILSAGLTIDPAGRFLYTSFLADPELNGFGIDAISGALARLAGDPFPVDEPFEDITTTH